MTKKDTSSLKRVVPIGILTGVTLGVVANVNLDDGHISLVKPNAVHAQTVTRGAVNGGFQLQRGSAIKASGLFGGGVAGFDLHVDRNNSWIYCINVDTYDQSTRYGMDGKMIDSNGTTVASTMAGLGANEIPGTPLTVDSAKRSGLLQLLQFAGNNGYQGLLPYQNEIFSAGGRTFGPDAGGRGGMFDAFIMQCAVHYLETGENYYRSGARNQKSAMGGNYHPFRSQLDSGRIYGLGASGSQVKTMVHKLIDKAKSYKAPTLDDYSKQSFTLDVQAGGKRYVNNGASAETDWGKKLSVASEKHGLPDDQVGTDAIAVSGSNLDDKSVTVSVMNTEADSDVEVNGINIKSKAMTNSDIVGFQVSKTPVHAKSDGVTDMTSDRQKSIDWDDQIHKLGDPVNFGDINNHYVRVVVKRNGNWHGFNKLHLRITTTIPGAKGSIPLGVIYSDMSNPRSSQAMSTTKPYIYNYQPIQMTTDMIFHVRQPNDPHTTKDIRAINSSDAKMFMNADDKHIGETGSDNNRQDEIFADGSRSRQPKMLTQLNGDQQNQLGNLLRRNPTTGSLTPGGEYAYTLHLKTGRDIQKLGSEELKNVIVNDTKLPKGFVYKTAVVTYGSADNQKFNKALSDNTKFVFDSRKNSLHTTVGAYKLLSGPEFNDLLRPVFTSDDGEIDITIFGTVDPNLAANASVDNKFDGVFKYDTHDEDKPSNDTHNPVKIIKQDAIKGVFSGDPNDFLKKVAKVNPKFGQTAGITGDPDNKAGYLSMKTTNADLARTRALNTNMTGNETGVYGKGSNEVILPSAYNGILDKSLTVHSQREQGQLYYVVIANSGNQFQDSSHQHAKGFERLHFSDYLDPNLELDLKNRPMMGYDLTMMQSRKAGADNSVMTPFSANGGSELSGSSKNVQSYMSNIIFDTTNQLNPSAKREFSISTESQKALSNGFGAYVNPTDMKSAKDGIGKVGSKEYTKFYRSTKAGKGYSDFTDLGAFEDTDGHYDANMNLNGAGNTKGWYAFAHGGVEGGSTQALRDLDGRQRVSWTVTGSDAQALSGHTVMFMVPVKVKDDAKYVTNNNQKPDIMNDAYFNGSNSRKPVSDMHDGENTNTTDHGNGGGYSNTVYVYPLRKDLQLEKLQNVGDKEGWTKNKKHENFDNDFKFKLQVTLPNWADKNNLDNMRGRDAKFAIRDNMELPYDVKDVKVYDATDHKYLVENLSSGLSSGLLAFEKQPGWDSKSQDQHPRLMYRPYGNVTSTKPQDVFKLANHKLSIEVTVNAPFEQNGDNHRLGRKLSKTQTDFVYNKYMHAHENRATHRFDIPNKFDVTHQSTTTDTNDGVHESNTVVTDFGSKGEISVDALRIDTNRADSGHRDHFKMLISTKSPFLVDNHDFDGKVRVQILADPKDNNDGHHKLSKQYMLYDQTMDLDKITNVKSVVNFNSAGADKMKDYQQGAQAIGKYTLNGNLATDTLDKGDKDYYTGVNLKEHGYLKADSYNGDGSIDSDNSNQKYDKHRRPLYVRVRVIPVDKNGNAVGDGMHGMLKNEQSESRDISVNGDRSYRGSDGTFVAPFSDGMVGRADLAYRNGVDPRFASISPESSYSYFGQNPNGNEKAIGKDATQHTGISMIQTIFDSTQLHRFDNTKAGKPVEKQGNVDQTIGAGGGDGIRNDVRLQRFGWGNINSKPNAKDANSNTDPQTLLANNKMQLIFDSQLQNGSAVKYKAAPASAVQEAKDRYYATTGADVTTNYGDNGSFWNFGKSGMKFNDSLAKNNGFAFVNNHDDDMNVDRLHADVQNETGSVDKGHGDRAFTQVPRAVEKDANLQPTTAWGAKVDKTLTNMQTSRYAVNGKWGTKAIDWNHDQDTIGNNGSHDVIADNRARDIVIENGSGISSFYNSPNAKQDSNAAKVYADKKANGELATDAGDFFATEIGNNYKNYKFFNRSLHHGTGQVGLTSPKDDPDVISSKYANNARNRKFKGEVDGGQKFYLPMWFTDSSEHDTFGRGTNEASINPLIYYSDGDIDRINADYSDVNFTRWLRIFGHRYGFNSSESSDYDSILVSGHLGNTKSSSLNDHENNALNSAQRGKPQGMFER